MLLDNKEDYITNVKNFTSSFDENHFVIFPTVSQMNNWWLKNQNQNLNVTEEKKATATEIDILRNHVRQCWNAPYAANELNKIINLKIFTNPDGSVVNVQIIDVAFYKKDPVYRAAADSARRAVKDCSPLPLPKNKYDLFKIFTFNFDTSFING